MAACLAKAPGDRPTAAEARAMFHEATTEVGPGWLPATVTGLVPVLPPAQEASTARPTSPAEQAAAVRPTSPAELTSPLGPAAPGEPASPRGPASPFGPASPLDPASPGGPAPQAGPRRAGAPAASPTVGWPPARPGGRCAVDRGRGVARGAGRRISRRTVLAGAGLTGLAAAAGVGAAALVGTRAVTVPQAPVATGPRLLWEAALTRAAQYPGATVELGDQLVYALASNVVHAVDTGSGAVRWTHDFAAASGGPLGPTSPSSTVSWPSARTPSSRRSTQ